MNLRARLERLTESVDKLSQEQTRVETGPGWSARVFTFLQQADNAPPDSDLALRGRRVREILDQARGGSGSASPTNPGAVAEWPI